MKINQVSVAPCVKFFERNLKERWELESYNNINEPCLFFGVENQYTLINNHVGPKIIWIISPSDAGNVRYISIKENVTIIGSPFLSRISSFRVKDVEISIKDYSMFKPKPLGDKIYTYLGIDGNRGEFNPHLIHQIQQRIPYEIIYHIGDSYLSSEDLKKNYYDKCFLNINLSYGNGMTTVRELGFMGIKTIMNTGYKFPSIINYSNVEDIIKIINSESKKIGTIQDSMDCHTAGEEWKNLDFWFKPKIKKQNKMIQMRNHINTAGLIDLIKTLPEGLVMAEIGCYAGQSTKMFMQSGKVEKLFAIDIWEDSLDIYRNIIEGHSFNLVEKAFDESVADYNVVKYKSTFDRVESLLPQLDFIYIDANHEYDYVKKDIQTALKKLKPKGIISGHDYHYTSPGVIKCVNEFFGKPDIVFTDHSWLVHLK